MTVKAKFRCNAVLPNSWNGKSTTAYLNPIYGTEGENADYSKATPSGSLTIVIDDEVPASKFFEQGKDYYLTFEAVE